MDRPGYLSIIADFVEFPERAAARVGDRRPFALGALCFAYGGASVFMAQSVSGRISFGAGPFMLLLFSLWHLLAGFLLAGILHMVVDAGREPGTGSCRGTAVGLFVLLGLSDLVWALALPAVLILRLLSLDRGLVLLALFSALGLGNFSLRARSIKDNYSLGIGKAWAVLIAPYAAFSLILIAVVSLAIVGIAHSVLRMLP